MVFSKNGQAIACGDRRTYNTKVRAWDMESHNWRDFQVPGTIRHIAVSPDGRSLATVTDVDVEVWDFATGHRLGPGIWSKKYETVAFLHGRQDLLRSYSRVQHFWEVLEFEGFDVTGRSVSQVVLCIESQASHVICPLNSDTSWNATNLFLEIYIKNLGLP